MQDVCVSAGICAMCSSWAGRQNDITNARPTPPARQVARIALERRKSVSFGASHDGFGSLCPAAALSATGASTVGRVQGHGGGTGGRRAAGRGEGRENRAAPSWAALVSTGHGESAMGRLPGQQQAISAAELNLERRRVGRFAGVGCVGFLIGAIQGRPGRLRHEFLFDCRD